MAESTIPMMGAQLDTASPIYKADDQQMKNAMATQQTLKMHYDNLDAREKSRLQSVIAGAVQLKPFLDNQDTEGALQFLTQRRAALQNRMGSGENVDTQETDYAIEALRSGNTQQLSQEIQGLMAAGQVYGILNQKDAPSNVQEWQYYQGLSPAEQEQYLTMKRSNSVVNLGGQQIVPSQVNPAGAPQAAFQVTPKPEEMPAFQAEQEAAKLQGRGETPPNVVSQRGREGVSFILDQMRADYAKLNQLGGAVDINKSGPENVGAYLGGTGVGQAVGKLTGSEVQSVRNAINNKLPGLINSIRETTGMGASQLNSNVELQFYLQQASNPSSNDIQSNLQALDMLDYLYGENGIRSKEMRAQNSGQQQPTQSQAPGGQVVQVMSEEEIYTLPPGTRFMFNGRTGTVE